MATTVENRKCPKCGTKYRTKVKKGGDTRRCPACPEDQRLGSSESQPSSTAKDSAFA